MDTAIKEKIDKQLGSNLRRGPGNPAWQKGMPSPNPNGRTPKPFCMTSALVELQQGNPKDVIARWEKKGPLTGAQRSAIAMQREIEKGNVQAFNQVADRVEGKITDHTDVTSNGQSIAPKETMVFQMPDGSTVTSKELATAN